MATTTVIRPASVHRVAPASVVGAGRPPHVRLGTSPPSGSEGASRFVRRRVVAALVVGAVLFGGAVRAVAAFGVGPASNAGRRPAVHVVQPGETLWSIAQALQPGGDTVRLVQRLMALNGGTDLQVGQPVVLPTG